MTEVKQLPKRSELPVEKTWNLDTIFPDDNAYQAAFKAVEAQTKGASAFVGTLKNSGEALLKALDFELTVFRKLENVYNYSSLKNSQDTSNSTYQGYVAQAGTLYASTSEAFAFVEPEILAIPAETLQQFQQSTPGLALYEHYIASITDNRAHVLSAKEEALIAAAGDIFSNPSNTFGVLTDANLTYPIVKDNDGNNVQLTEGVYGGLVESTNRDVRKNAFEGLYQVFDQFKDTLAQTLSGNVKVDNYNAKIHNYSSARQAAMAHNHIPESVYDTLVQEVNDHLPLLHRYVALRKKTLKLKELHSYDLYTPITGEPSLKYTFEEARQEALKALSVMGPDYLSIVNEAFDKRWIDVPQNKGKRSGAFSGGGYDTNPFILLNWEDNLNNLYTLVHEMGHSVHSYYTRHNQPYVYGDYPIFVAEIASTTNENTLTNYLLNTQKDKRVRAYILNYYLDGFKGTIFRQTQFAEFEHLIHQADQNGTPLTADYMTKEYGAMNTRYYGPALEKDPQIAIEWSRIPHFYYNYYVYQYATGFAAASTLSHKITSGEPEALAKFITYLKSGSSEYPIDIMKKAGVDMTKTGYLDEAFKVFEERLNELEGILDELA